MQSKNSDKGKVKEEKSSTFLKLNEYIKLLVGRSKNKYKRDNLYWLYVNFRKYYENEQFAQGIFGDLLDQSVEHKLPLHKVIIDFFIENGLEKTKKNPFEVTGEITTLDAQGNWCGIIRTKVKDIKNPGVSQEQELHLNTAQKDKKLANEALKKVLNNISNDFIEKMNLKNAVKVNSSTGKII